MPQSKIQPEPLWPYLRYATLSDVRKELPTSLAAWAVMTAISLAILWGLQFVPSASSNWENPLPHWVTFAAIWAGATWFLRGKTFRYQFPLCTFNAWLGLSLCVAALAFLGAKFPDWVSIPVFWAVLLLASMLDTLNAHGKENSEALNAVRA
jgi:hypothetical protein